MLVCCKSSEFLLQMFLDSSWVDIQLWHRFDLEFLCCELIGTNEELIDTVTVNQFHHLEYSHGN